MDHLDHKGNVANISRERWQCLMEASILCVALPIWWWVRTDVYRYCVFDAISTKAIDASGSNYGGKMAIRQTDLIEAQRR